MNGIKGNQPPKNKITIKVHIKIILAYLLRKTKQILKMNIQYKTTN